MARVFPDRQTLLEWAVKLAPAGSILEFGVYEGASLKCIADALPHRLVYGFDSFEGLPEDWRPGFRRGSFKTEVPIVPPNARLVIGEFSRTLPCHLARNHEPIGFIHIDCDLYSSTKTVLELCHPRLLTGAIIVFDEYMNYPGWEQHEHRAFEEYKAAYGTRFTPIATVAAGEQLAVCLQQTVRL